MAVCKKCGKNLKKNEIKYCPECEETLKNKLLSLEKEIALEEKLKRDEKKADKLKKKSNEDSIKDHKKGNTKDHKKDTTKDHKKDHTKEPTTKEGTPSDDTSNFSGDDLEDNSFSDTQSSRDNKIVSARMFAALIDLLIGLSGWWFCAKVFSILGWIFISVYMLLKDVLFDQGSPGKVLTGLAVVRTGSREPLTLQVSMVRNSTIAAGFIVMGIGRLLMFDVPIIPDPFMTLGALLFTVGALVFTGGWCLELYWMNKDVKHYRFGDKIARTTVISSDDFEPYVEDFNEDNLGENSIDESEE